MTRRGIFLAAGLLLAASPAWAQREGYIVRRPTAPSTEALDRLNLKLAWQVYLPVANIADSPLIVQVMGGQVFAQMRTGVLYVLDARTGDTQWRFVFPIRSTNIYPVAINSNTVFVVNGVRLFALDRRTGFKVFEQALPSTPATGPSADSQQVYVTLVNNRVLVYSHTNLILPTPPNPPPLPDPPPPPTSLEPQSVGDTISSRQRTPDITMLQRVTPPYALHGRDAIPAISILPTVSPPYKLEGGSRTPDITIINSLEDFIKNSDLFIRDKSPTKLFEVYVNRGVNFAPTVSNDALAIATDQRLVLGLDKTQNKELFTFPTGSAITAALGQFDDTVYVPTADSNLFALNLRSGRESWRFTAGGAMDRKPFVTADSVYAAGDRSGITRVSRDEGERIWYNPDADRIVAMSPKFIYATDRSGRLHVIDRMRGLGLSSLDISSFGPAVVNEENDRLFLTGHNGVLLCLHDKDYRVPVPTIAVQPKKEPPKKEPEPEPEPKKEPPKIPAPKKLPPKKAPEMPKKEPEAKKVEPKME